MFDKWKIQLTIAINVTSSEDYEQEHIIHSKSNNIKCTYSDDPNEVADELFESLC